MERSVDWDWRRWRRLSSRHLISEPGRRKRSRPPPTRFEGCRLRFAGRL